jgi:iron(III) transport system substrate-binding protein
VALAVAATALVALVASCGSGASAPASAPSGASAATGAGPLVIYSGRNEKLVGPLLKNLEQAIGAPVTVRYAGTAELAAQLLEEGQATNADLFFSQDAGALGALAAAGRLAPLPQQVRSAVPPEYQDKEGRWVATSLRARVVAYHPTAAPEAARLSRIDQVLDQAYRGQVAIAPTNASFQAFVTALRVQRGEVAAREWLTKLKANQPQVYDSNELILDAVDAGRAKLGLINHYYWFQKAKEKGVAAMTAKLAYLDAADPGGLVNVAGVGVLVGSDQAALAVKAAQYLVSRPAQEHFVSATSEYPVLAGVDVRAAGLPALKPRVSGGVDLGALDSLSATLTLLDEVGLT